MCYVILLRNTLLNLRITDVERHANQSINENFSHSGKSNEMVKEHNFDSSLHTKVNLRPRNGEDSNPVSIVDVMLKNIGCVIP